MSLLRKEEEYLYLQEEILVTVSQQQTSVNQSSGNVSTSELTYLKYLTL